MCIRVQIIRRRYRRFLSKHIFFRRHTPLSHAAWTNCIAQYCIALCVPYFWHCHDAINNIRKNILNMVQIFCWISDFHYKFSGEKKWKICRRCVIASRTRILPLQCSWHHRRHQYTTAKFNSYLVRRCARVARFLHTHTRVTIFVPPCINPPTLFQFP